MSREPIVATDADTAGRAAADRHYWMLTSLASRPRYVQLPEATDPASLLSEESAKLLNDAIQAAKPMWIDVLHRKLEDAPADHVAALVVAASAPPEDWPAAIATVADRFGAPTTLVRASLAPLVKAWNDGPRPALLDLGRVRNRIEARRRVGESRRVRADDVPDGPQRGRSDIVRRVRAASPREGPPRL